jgi:hypothetical protein
MQRASPEAILWGLMALLLRGRSTAFAFVIEAPGFVVFVIALLSDSAARTFVPAKVPRILLFILFRLCCDFLRNR